MKYLKVFIIYLFITAIVCALLIKYKTVKPTANSAQTIKDTVGTATKINPVYADTANALYVNTGNTTPRQLVSYAETLIGIPYVYASSDSAVGFDCSGFITFVFNHFHITVPRSSVEFTNMPHQTSVADAKPADLILFTGTDSTEHIVGHMGIVVQNKDGRLLFIHSTSGKANGVTITLLNDYYKSRFVKIIRVFPQNENNI